MKITRALVPCISALTFATIPGLHAQSVQPAARPGASLPSPALTPPEGLRPLTEVRIPAGRLVEIVRVLNQLIEESNMAPLNVIYSPEVQAAYAPEITLRNVTGPDALRLIAAATGCDMETLQGQDGQTIGYRLHSLVSGPLNHGHDHGAAAPGVPALGNQLGQNHPAHGNAPGGLAAPSADPAGVHPVVTHATIHMPGNMGGVQSYGGDPFASSVRVYGLGVVTQTVKFAEIETTLREMLKAAGIEAGQARIGFHEKTNVLVVNGAQRVHDLVAQLLQALQMNASAAETSERASEGSRRAAIEAEVRLNAEQAQRIEVMKRLSEAEDQVRNLQRELDRARPTAPKTH